VLEAHARYILLIEQRNRWGREAELAMRVHANLARLNEEYAAKCSSGRLLPLAVREVPAGTWNRIRTERTSARGNVEEFKHIYLVQDLGFVERMTTGYSNSAQAPAAVPLGGMANTPAAA